MRGMRTHPLLDAMTSLSGGARSASVFIDGAARGNPGKAAIGVVFQDAEGRAVKTIAKAIGTATNNIAEYSALIMAMQQALMDGVQDLAVYTDSELVARQFSGEYRVKDPVLQVLFQFVLHLRTAFKKVTVTHVAREKNKLADRQANRALDDLL